MEHLANLSLLAETLNQQTDSYTHSLAELEKSLRKTNLGIEAWVDLAEISRSGSPNRETSIMSRLGYAKTDEGWCLAVKQIRREHGYWENDLSCPWTNEYDEDEPKPLLKSSRELRLQAAGQIERLLKQLEANAEETLRSLLDASALLGNQRTLTNQKT